MNLNKPNRMKSQKASKSKFWCNRCDAALVGQHGKCSNCKAVQAPHKVK